MRLSRILVALFIVPLGARAAAPIVFVHGIKGAILDDEKGERGWLTAAQAAGLSSPDLSLPLRWDGSAQKSDRWRPVAVLEALPLLGSFVEKKIYGNFCDALKSSGRTYRLWPYDWRRDLNETAGKLTEFLEKARAESGGVAPTVVGHSMGGMLALAVLRKRPDLFSAVALVGSPIRGGIGFLPDLHEGVRTGLNGRILAPEVLGTFPSVYAFFPLDSERLVRDEQGTPIRTNFYRLDTWRGMGLGLYAEGRKRPEHWDAFLEEALSKAQAFRKAMLEGEAANVPVLVVRSERHRTLAAIRRAGNSKLKWDFSVEPKENGDGRVRAEDALPPPNLGEFRLVATDGEHEALLDDPQVQKAIFALP